MTVYWKWLKEEGFLMIGIMLLVSFLFDALLIWVAPLKSFLHVKNALPSFIVSFVGTMIYSHVFWYTKWLKSEAKRLLS
jgi:hypothetical protein